ncbi:MAG TPA: hypothetical protein VID27_11140 [Blastocatellia bacterium]
MCDWLTTSGAALNYLAAMNESSRSDLQQRVIEFARSVEAPEDSFLISRSSLSDSDQIRSTIDGITLAFISFCYHRHPRGENVHEVMEELEQVAPDSAEAREIEQRADDAAALQIPFIVTLNRLLEEYFDLRHQLESRL